MNRLSNKITYSLALLLTGVLYLLLEWNTTPTLADDIVYEFKFNLALDYSHPIHIKSLDDVVQSMSAFYYVINGRYPTQFLNQVFLSLLPKHLLDIVNTLLFVALIHFSIVFLRIKESRTAFFGIFVSLLFLIVIGFQSAMLWSNGTFSYLWVLAPTLLYFILLQSYGCRSLSWYHWIYCLPAILVGWGHEGLALPVSIGFFVYAIVNRRTSFRQLSFPMMLYYGIGMLLCLSPAVWSRASSGLTIKQHIMSGCVVILLQSRALWVLLLTIIVLWFKNRSAVKKSIKNRLWLWVACFMAYGVAFGCGEATTRVSFFGDFIALLLLLDLLQSCSLSLVRKSSAVLSVIAFIMSIAAIYCCRLQVGDYQYALKQMENPSQTVIKTHSTVPENGFLRYTYNTYVMPFVVYDYYSAYMAFDATDINTRCIAAKYHKPTMFFLPEKIINKIENCTLSASHFIADKADNLYALRLNGNKSVRKVFFNLRQEDTSKLSLKQRVTAYNGSVYELDDFHWQVVSVDGTRILVLTMPQNNILRRVKSIAIE